MQVIEVLARLVGAFYALGGLFAIRSLAMSEMIDRAIDMISLKKEQPKAVVRRWVLGTGAALTGASGLAAALISAWAVPLFLLNVALQAGWLAWAATAFPPEDEDDARGRRSSRNALVGYAVVTVVVLYLWRDGRLAAFGDPWTAVPAAVGTIAYLVYLYHSLRWRRPSGGLFGATGEGDAVAPACQAVRQPARIRFVVHPWRYPMVDADDGRLLNHFEYLPIELAGEIEAWHDAFADLVAFAPLEATTPFASEEQEAEHRTKAEAFVENLRATYGAGNVEGPLYVSLQQVREEEATLAQPPAD